MPAIPTGRATTGSAWRSYSTDRSKDQARARAVVPGRPPGPGFRRGPWVGRARSRPTGSRPRHRNRSERQPPGFPPRGHDGALPAFGRPHPEPDSSFSAPDPRPNRPGKLRHVASWRCPRSHEPAPSSRHRPGKRGSSPANISARGPPAHGLRLPADVEGLCGFKPRLSGSVCALDLHPPTTCPTGSSAVKVRSRLTRVPAFRLPQ
jgi:hypothetical protein